MLIFPRKKRKTFSSTGTGKAWSPGAKKHYRIILSSKNNRIGSDGDFNMGENREKKAKGKCVLFYPILGSSGGKQMFPPEFFQPSAKHEAENWQS